MCASVLSLKCYFLLLPPDMVERESSNLVHTPDVIIPDQDGPFSFAGKDTQLLASSPRKLFLEKTEAYNAQVKAAIEQAGHKKA